MGKKGVSATIAVLLMMIITISMAVLAYTFTFGLFEKYKSLFSVVDTVDQYVIIENLGEEYFDTFDVAQVDGQDVTLFPQNTDVVYSENFNDNVADGWSGGPQWSTSFEGPTSYSYKSDGQSGATESLVNGPEFPGVQKASVKFDLRFGQVRTTDVMIVIDRSGSMILNPANPPAPVPHRLDAAKQSAKDFIDILDPSLDRVGVVSFGWGSTLEHELTFPTPGNKIALDNAIDGIPEDINQNTEMFHGINNASNELSGANSRPEAKWIQIFLSDGTLQCHFPHYPTDPWCWNEFGLSVQNAQNTMNTKGESIIIYTIGFGADANETTLNDDIAIPTGGSYFFAPTGAQLLAIYQQIAGLITVPGSASMKARNGAGQEVFEVRFSIGATDEAVLIDSSSGAVVDQYTGDFDFDIWYPINIVTSGDKVTVFLNHEKILSGNVVRGGDFKSDLELGSEDAVVFFDNIIVEEPNPMKPGDIGSFIILEKLDPGAHEMLLCNDATCTKFKTITK